MSSGAAVSSNAVCGTIMAIVVVVACNPKLCWNGGYPVISCLPILVGPLSTGSLFYIESHPIYQVICIAVHIIDTNIELEWALWAKTSCMASVDGIRACTCMCVSLRYTVCNPSLTCTYTHMWAHIEMHKTHTVCPFSSDSYNET